MQVTRYPHTYTNIIVNKIIKLKNPAGIENRKACIYCIIDKVTS